MTPYTAPQMDLDSFNCPHCYAYAHQEWFNVTLWKSVNRNIRLPGYSAALCARCTMPSLWTNGIMIYPDVATAPLPNEDLSAEIQYDYLEARRIVSKSPRGAAALLRLCIQKLMIQLGLPGKNINDDIHTLAVKGLDTKIINALDTVRVIGNEGVHPGEMDLRDDRDTANFLFELVNRIASDLLTNPRELDALYNRLPEEKLKGIINRDKNSPSNT